MKTIYLAAVLSLLNSQTTWAAPKNPLCQKAFVKSLTLNHETKFPNGVDVCALTESKTTPVMKKAIADIQEIHQKAAALMGVKLEQILPQGIEITINASFGGLNGSAKADTGTISLDTIPNPVNWINRGIYAHEFGHYLSFMATPFSPLALKSTHRTSTFGETFADTIALALVGEDTSPEKSLPLCFSAARVGLNNTYKAPFGNFDYDYASHKLMKCCEENGNHSEDVKTICDGMFVGEDGEIHYPENFDNEPFSVKKMAKKSIDAHNIGVPLNSFLKSLAASVKRNIPAEFMASFRDPMQLNFQCGLPGAKLPSQKVFVQAYSLKEKLDKVKASLSAEQQKTFQQLLIKHDVATAILLDEMDQGTRAGIVARAEFIKVLAKPTDAYLKKKKMCRGVFMDWEQGGSQPECDISCKKI